MAKRHLLGLMFPDRMRFMEIEVAIPTPLFQTFTYAHPEPLQPGVRVMVAFKHQRETIGVVVSSSPDGQENRPFKLKPLRSVIDAEPVYSPAMLRLAKWMSHYYVAPLGDVLKTMLPASRSKKAKRTYTLKSEYGEQVAFGDYVFRDLFARTNSLDIARLRKKVRDLCPELGLEEIQVLLKTWERQGILSLTQNKQVKARKTNKDKNEKGDQSDPVPNQPMQELNSHQKKALTAIVNEGLSVEAPKPFLLFGVTGSGKTEVFLHAIAALRELDDPDKPINQCLVLVPEISLTPQMTRIFEMRFPGEIAVVHSNMSDEDRWQQLNRIRKGEARILLGPRSAVFGPFCNLKLLIVDEEHDSSYKQAQGLPYNGRDIAVVRGQIENATVLLGSATPSMESWHNASIGKYSLLELPERATAKPLPTVRTVAAKSPYSFGTAVGHGNLLGAESESDRLFTDEVLAELKDNFEQGRQSIVLVNRRGFAYYLYDLDERHSIDCPQCSISMAVHGRTRIVLKCHYCDKRMSLEAVMKQAPGHTLVAVGYGSQKTESILEAKIPGARLARLDSDTVADPSMLVDTLQKFRDGHIDILVGTQILAKGHDFPNVTLVVILEVDQLLGMPDFRGSERTYQLLVQAAGRSGRAQLPGRVIVQSVRAEHAVVQMALEQNFRKFAESELIFRREAGYPPYARLTLVELSAPDKNELIAYCAKIENHLDQFLQCRRDLLPVVKILGPAPASVEVLRGRHRYMMMILSPRHEVMRLTVEALCDFFKLHPGGRNLRYRIDVDPQSTL